MHPQFFFFLQILLYFFVLINEKIIKIKFTNVLKDKNKICKMKISKNKICQKLNLYKNNITTTIRKDNEMVANTLFLSLFIIFIKTPLTE